jgi:hypothetical protein
MPFHIGADSGQGRSSGGLSVGGDAVGLPTGVLCFRAAFFIALAVDFSVAGRPAVGFSSGANATKTDAGGCDAPATTTPSNRMREGMSHMPRNPGFIWKQTFEHRFEAEMQGKVLNR